jgi:aldehyde dehydrogenase (NAD+)
MKCETCANYIGGKWRGPRGDKVIEQRNPARLSQVTSRFPAASAEDAHHAVDAAEQAFPGWRGLSPLHRAQILKRARWNLEERREPLARLLTLENGKTLAESRGEIDYALADMEFQIGEGIRLYGETVPVSMPGVLAYTTRHPVGVVALIGPWNFPVNVPAGKCVAALMAGCTAVFKCASKTPQTGLRFVECFIDAGLPPGVLNFVTGYGSEAGNALVSDPRVRGVSFTGSTAVGKAIQRAAAQTMARTQLEMGGKNPLVVLEDADLDRAADDTIAAAFGCAGQKCTCTSRVIVVRKVARELTERLLARVKALRVGNGMDEGVDMGPVCGEDQLETVLEYIETGKSEGAKILAGGHRLAAEDYDDGCFVAPTVFGNVTSQMTIAQEEIFGPVLAVIEVEDFDEAVEVSNGVRYGLSSSIYTSDIERAFTFVERSETGVTHINLMTALNEPQLSFGGIKESGFGMPEAGRTGSLFFTELKVAYVRYSQPPGE